MVARIIFLLTFVLTQIASAAPSSPNPDFTEPAVDESTGGTEAQEKKQSVDIAPAPPVPPSDEEPEIFYRYRNAITFHVGLVYDRVPIKDPDKPGVLSRFGTQYLFPVGLQDYEAGADLFSDGTGLIQLHRRWIFTKTRFRPYTKAGMGLRVQPSDQLATALKFENYQLRGAVGFEDLLNDPSSFRLELDGMLSTKTLQISVLLGGVWGW
jgi:hypothetical protein